LRATKVAPYPNGQQHTQTAVGDLDLAYVYNKEGKLTNVTYPNLGGSTPRFTYAYDTMMRPQGMTDQNNASVVSSVDYGAANELLHMTYNGGTETRVYNNMLQLTSISGLGQNVTYTFPAAGSNAGRIASQTDNITGETVTYLYDSLNRLTSASTGAWGQTFSYDGFGNLTARAGSGSAQSTSITTPANAANQLSGNYAYDANGNLISTGYAYDAENRMSQSNAGATHYAYDGQNKRIWQASFINCSGDSCLNSDSISLFGIDGRMIGTYLPSATWNNTQTQLTLSFSTNTQRVYFGSKLVATLDWQGNRVGVVQDRLGSVGKYYPFGEERNSPQLPNDQVKFATYTRDLATALDYADQRYYTATLGRFMSADPYHASGGPSDPQSWNRYSYVQGDPINFLDPSGLERCGSGFSDNGSGTFSITVVDCIAFIPVLPPSAYARGLALSPRPPIAVDNSGIPPIICPNLPELPADIPANQIELNIIAAHEFLDLQIRWNYEGNPMLNLFAYFAYKFAKNGDWDYKKNYTNEDDVAKAKDFGNFNFGAVLESFGFSYFFTQNAAGVGQIGICMSGGYCGVGVPGVVYPFGDSIDDAVNVRRGYNYEKKIDLGCRQQ